MSTVRCWVTPETVCTQAGENTARHLMSYNSVQSSRAGTRHKIAGSSLRRTPLDRQRPLLFAAPASAPGTPPDEYWLVTGLYDPKTGLRVPAGDSDHLDLGTVHINRPAVPFLPSMLDVRYPQESTLCIYERLFGEVSLLGYDHCKRSFGHAPDTPLHPGDVLHLVFFWRAEIQPKREWRFEASLVDDSCSYPCTAIRPFGKGAKRVDLGPITLGR